MTSRSCKTKKAFIVGTFVAFSFRKKKNNCRLKTKTNLEHCNNSVALWTFYSVMSQSLVSVPTMLHEEGVTMSLEVQCVGMVWKKEPDHLPAPSHSWCQQEIRVWPKAGMFLLSWQPELNAWQSTLEVMAVYFHDVKTWMGNLYGTNRGFAGNEIDDQQFSTRYSLGNLMSCLNWHTPPLI